MLIVEFLLQKRLISFFNSGGNCLILKRKNVRVAAGMMLQNRYAKMTLGTVWVEYVLCILLHWLEFDSCKLGLL